MTVNLKGICKWCKGPLEPMWWQDVPGVGDLCARCHDRWLASAGEKGKPRGKTR